MGVNPLPSIYLLTRSYMLTSNSCLVLHHLIPRFHQSLNLLPLQMLHSFAQIALPLFTAFVHVLAELQMGQHYRKLLVHLTQLHSVNLFSLSSWLQVPLSLYLFLLLSGQSIYDALIPEPLIHTETFSWFLQLSASYQVNLQTSSVYCWHNPFFIIRIIHL